MAKLRLTQKIIKDCIAGTDNGDQNARLAKTFALVAFILGGTGFLATRMILVLVFCWAFALLCYFLARKSSQVIQDILQKKYVLRYETCISKDKSYSSDSADMPYLYFSTTGRCALTFSHLILNSTAAKAQPDLYETTEPGDACYLLCTESGLVLFIFNSKFWELETSEFSQQGFNFVPNK